jgi:transketolase
MSSEQITNAEKNVSERAADLIRILSASMVERAQSGHPGGPMGGADFMHILFTEFMVFDPENPQWPFRDRFFLDPGHMSAMLYAQMGLLGYYTPDEWQQFRQWGSPTPGHPERDLHRGIENTSGPLGLGHAFGAGAAIAERFLVDRFGEWLAHFTYVYISDGGIQEEISQGVGRIAGHLGLGNLILFYDANDIQLSTKVEEVTNEDTAAKYLSWGWDVQTIPGNDQQAIRNALRKAKSVTDKPSLIIGKTIMGKGAVTADGKSFEGEVETHGKPLGKSKASFPLTIKHLGGDPENPFHVFPDVAEYYEAVKEKCKLAAQRRRDEEENWRTVHKEKAVLLDQFLSGKPPALDWKNIVQKQGEATRAASGKVLELFANQVGNMIVSSADLSNSDNTQSFLNKSKAFRKGDFSGSFLQAGVSELTMAALSVGMALHGGVIPVCATFFAFSDYMKPVLRLAALMEIPVIFVWTHDSFRVGEDGPTHQPIEQEAQVRLLEKLHNHSGNPSFLALRPADADETTVAWKMAIENVKTPTGLILSRQNIVSLPASNGLTRYENALGAEKGAYIVSDCEGKPDIILIGNGSEVSTLYAGALLLREKENKKVRLVSLPSEGLFLSQPKEYRENILPKGVPRLGLTAGLPVSLEGIVGAHGVVLGLSHFGYSAPADVLDEKFGFTGARVFAAAQHLLNSPS